MTNESAGAGEVAQQTAMLLTEDEWQALRTVADFYLVATEWAVEKGLVSCDERDICHRIMEATDA